MRLNNILSKIGLIWASISLLLAYSCKDDLPSGLDTSANQVVLKSIKIVNTGEDGNVVLEGEIDENAKSISFPRIDTLTDFTSLKFEAELSDGAMLEQDVFNIEFEEGKSEKGIMLKVQNSPRYREYVAMLRLKVPVYGGDFSKAKLYNFAGYSAFSGQATRGSGFDGEHVLVVQRAVPSSTPHLLALSDLKNNNTNNKKFLNVTGVGGGTYDVNCGALVNGHTYIVNLSTSTTNPLRIYHWASPTAAPEMVVDVLTANIPGAGARHGDNMSVSLDENGDGFIFLVSNDNPSKILRFTVENYNQVSDPFVISSSVNYGQWSSYLRVETSDYYLLTAYQKAISVVNSVGSVSYVMKNTSIPWEGSDARVITFNNKRYLLMVTVSRTGDQTCKLLMYDVSRGRDIVEALGYFEAGNTDPIYEFVLSGATNTAPSTQSGWYIEKDGDGHDDKLYLFCATTDAGFAVIEVPKGISED